jgi:hypothetical protein
MGKRRAMPLATDCIYDTLTARLSNQLHATVEAFINKELETKFDLEQFLQQGQIPFETFAQEVLMFGADLFPRDTQPPKVDVAEQNVFYLHSLLNNQLLPGSEPAMPDPPTVAVIEMPALSKPCPCPLCRLHPPIHRKLKALTRMAMWPLAIVIAVTLYVAVRLHDFGEAPLGAYPLAVIPAAWFLGTRTALITSALSSVIFNLIFVPPVWTFTIPHKFEIVGFAAMVALSIVIPKLRRAESQTQRDDAPERQLHRATDRRAA